MEAGREIYVQIVPCTHVMSSSELCDVSTTCCSRSALELPMGEVEMLFW